MRRVDKHVRAALVDADDRQRALDEVCRRVLKGFVGRDVTPTLLLEAEATMRSELDEAIRQGKYVLPDGLALDRIEIGIDMRLKVFFVHVDQTVSRAVDAQPNNRIEALMAELDVPEKN